MKQTKTKRVMFIHHCGYWGGAGLSLLHILESLKNTALDMIVYCPSKPDNMIKQIKNLSVECFSSPPSISTYNHYSGSMRCFFSYKFFIENVRIQKSKSDIKKILKTYSPDIVVVNSMTLCYVGRIAKSLSIKTVCFHRESYAKGFIGFRTKLIKSSLSKTFDKVVFISNFDLKQTGNMRSKSYVVHDKVMIKDYLEAKVDTNKEKDFKELPTEKVKILYTGGMSYLKGAEVIVKALAKCKENVHLLFLQYDGIERKKKLSDYSSIISKLRFMLRRDYTAKVLALIDKNHLWDKVTFYPTVFNVEKFFLQSDFVVFPSIYPHQARPIYEAGAAKKPIIITKSENIAEFLTNGKNGFTFQKGNFNELAKLIDLLANNKELREQLGYQNYLQTIKKHNFITLRKELSDVFRFEH